MVTIVGPYQRIVDVNWGEDTGGHPPGAIKYVASHTAIVDSGQIVIMPYDPAYVVWGIGGFYAYIWTRPTEDPTAPYSWTQQYIDYGANSIGGNGRYPGEFRSLIGMGTTNEEALAGVDPFIAYEGYGGNYGRDWTGLTCIVDVSIVKLYNYLTPFTPVTRVVEPYSEVVCDFTDARIVTSSGSRYRPLGFTTDIQFGDPSTGLIPAMELVYDGVAE